ncbi:transporter [Rhodococcoides trifolii]|uniref:Transporter n=1 Tax=Rhodococcoides trifolii TaxID=908250 RepID=A0A917FMT0_9NOCA|nr:transporter [Rhodococcus trifolii]
MYKKKPRLFSVGLPLAIYLLFTLVPFYWMIVFAFRPAGSNSMLPWPITFDHFDTVWNTLGFSFFFKNSLIVAGLSLVLTTFVALATGYALARFKFRAKIPLVMALLCSQFVPGAMLLIPLFQVFREMGLVNNLFGLIVADTVFQLPLAAMLMAGFISQIPVELEEAAMVDGCSRLQAFRIIMLPLLRPGLIAVGSFAFIGSWNNFLFGLMFISSQDKFTLPVGLSYTIGSYNVDFGVLAAGGLIAAVPVVAVFAVIQKYLVQGLSAGAVKG